MTTKGILHKLMGSFQQTSWIRLQNIVFFHVLSVLWELRSCREKGNEIAVFTKPSLAIDAVQTPGEETRFFCRV